MPVSKRFLVLGVFVVGSFASFPRNLRAQEDTALKTSIEPPLTEPKKPMPIERLRLFFNTYPIPILSEGMGVGAEVTLSKYVSAWLVTDKNTQDSSNALITLGSQEKITWQKQQLALRFLMFGHKKMTPFIHVGHQWTKIYSYASPGLFEGPAITKIESVRGAYAGLGYRVMQSKNPNWMADFEINYEPGAKVDMQYSGGYKLKYVWGEEEDSNATLTTKVDYGPVLRVRVGYNF